VFARNLHRISARRDAPFVAVNCAAIPEDLVEAELFGVCKGAFTGATRDRAGRFERADSGILFLDEVGSLSLAAQGKLLRALQDMEIERVGGNAPQKVDVRVIAACNSNLAEQVQAGEFRHDLYYRLNVFPVLIPPLRERKEDIPLLTNLVRNKLCKRYNKPLTGFTEAAINALQDYDWPGNIRELENMVERGVVLAPLGHPVDVDHLFFHQEPLARASRADTTAPLSPPVPSRLDELKSSGLTLDQLEHCLLTDAVEDAGGNWSKAARTLGITRAQLAYRLGKKPPP
ncbi:MAG: sigma-54 dependent transcriptional regulator, partial [Gammaproteobacteria bacterium]